ncbi:38344_t:CDS:2, partial [Gigaspora margarita]
WMNKEGRGPQDFEYYSSEYAEFDESERLDTYKEIEDLLKEIRKKIRKDIEIRLL